MLTKEDKTWTKMSGNQKERGETITFGISKQEMEQAWLRVEDFQKRLRTTASIERAPGSGRPRMTRTAENVDAVGDLVKSQEN